MFSNIFYEVMDLDRSSFNDIFPAFPNQFLIAQASAVDRINYPIFNLGATLDQIREGISLDGNIEDTSEFDVQEFEAQANKEVTEIALEEDKKEVQECEKEKEEEEVGFEKKVEIVGIAAKENPVLPDERTY